MATLTINSSKPQSVAPMPKPFPAIQFDLDELAIITTHFNPVGYNLPRRNYWHWRNHLGKLANVLTTVEISFTDHFMIEDSHQIKAGPENILWQKEAALNVGLKLLPPHKKYVAWLDSDLLFHDPDWIGKGINMLQNGYSAIHLFSKIEYLGLNGTVIGGNVGAVWNQQTNSKHLGSPGGAWIADREYLDEIGGLPYYMITGGGDCATAEGLADVPAKHYKQQISDELQEWEGQWIEKAQAARRGRKPGYLPGLISHLYHGTRKNRLYVERTKLLDEFSPLNDVFLNSDGILEWTDNNPRFRKQIEKYFRLRKEDEAE